MLDVLGHLFFENRRTFHRPLFFTLVWSISDLIVSGIYVAHKHTFTCLDYLQNLNENVTETTRHIYDDLDFSFLDYRLIDQFFMIFRNVSQ